MFEMILIAVGAIWLVWYLSRNNANSSNIDSALSQRNRDWFSHISSFQSKAKTKDQKVNRGNVNRYKNQGLVDSGIVLPTNTQLDITDPIVDQYIETDVQLPFSRPRSNYFAASSPVLSLITHHSYYILEHFVCGFCWAICSI